MKTIRLTQNKTTIVDDDVFEYINQWKWFYNSGYAMRWGGGGLLNRKRIYLHREIIKTPDGSFTDHINGDRLDNRKENLRICNNSQNQANRHVLSRNSSGYRGVYWNKNEEKWRSHIKVDGVDIHLGYYKTKNDAAIAYNNAAQKYFEKYAQMNLVRNENE